MGYIQAYAVLGRSGKQSRSSDAEGVARAAHALASNNFDLYRHVTATLCSASLTQSSM